MRNRTQTFRLVLQISGLAGCFCAMIATAAPATPEAVTMVRPTYPPEAQRAGIEGCAILRFDISASGMPENIRVASSTPYPEFGDAAHKALEQWRFEPLSRNGKPAAFTNATQAFAFDLPGKSTASACGQGSAVAAVAVNPALPALATPPQESSAAPRSVATTAPPPPPAAPPATVMLNVTRPPVTETFETAADSGSTPAGRVTVSFCVDARGRTKHLKVVKSQPPGMFDEMALRIMHAAEFEPYSVNGSPTVACGITQTIVFKPAPRDG